ncbi:sensor histidine kinase [Sediminitomix flava]|uniref:histidine kinase n=1 Tax=Sediminitomix flava TaxID=379075 RepID=A0A315ZE19_SEDFL|nr:HAMP domain-containing sensor histidine kinase [Sediminitomix flava]PWJ43781.1 phospho-acceptor domain-containing protein [Sediminitomix flava]
MKALDQIRKYISGDAKTIEERTLLFSLFFGGIISSFFSLLYFVKAIDLMHAFYVYLISICFLTLFYYFKIKKNFVVTLIIFSFFEIFMAVFDWYKYGGVDNDNIALIFAMMIVNLSIIPHKFHKWVFTCILTLILTLNFLESFLQLDFQSRVYHKHVKIHQIVLCMIAAAVVLIKFKSDYQKTRLELIESKIELQKSLQKEKELNHMKSEFISMVSHQFRTPLTSIYSSSELINLTANHYLPNDQKEKAAKQFDRIYSSVNQLNSMMERLLLFGQMEANKMTLNKEWSNIEELTLKVVRSFYLNFPSEQLPQVRTLGEKREVFVDQNLIEQILLNLISNAHKYSSSDSPPEVLIHFARETFSIKVRDFGIGIPKDDLPYLFQAFHRAKNAKEIKGTGIGLTFVKKFVELHEGSVKVTSKENIGSTFKILFPYSSQENKPSLA